MPEGNTPGETAFVGVGDVEVVFEPVITVGEYHDMLAAKVVYDLYTSKTDNSKYIHAKSYWGIPM